MTDALVARLEAVTVRLESFVSNLGGAKKGGSGAEAKVPPQLIAFDAFSTKCVVPFVAVVKKIADIGKIAEMTERSFAVLRSLMEATGACKKPSESEFARFVEPISKTITEAERWADKRNPKFSFQKSFHEAVCSLQWVMTPAPRPLIEAQLEAADFHLINILTAAKKLAGDEQANYREYVKLLKALLTEMAAFAGENFKMGLEWNMKGGSLKDFKPGQSCAAPSCAASASASGEVPDAPGGVPDAPPAPEAPADLPSMPASGAADGAPDRSALFAQINQGTGISSGLKKVTADMKCKNLKDKPVLQPKDHEQKAAVKKAAEKTKAPPKLEIVKGTWFCENYESHDGELVIPDVEMKQSVYIAKCKNIVVRVPTKCKSIQIDNCQKIGVVFVAVVSTFEIVNSQRITVQCTEQCPSFAVDKTAGCQIIISKAVVDQKPSSPDIVTSNVSEVNLVVPGATDDADPIEIPIPEQYTSKYNPATRKVVTQPVSHGG